MNTYRFIINSIVALYGKAVRIVLKSSLSGPILIAGGSPDRQVELFDNRVRTFGLGPTMIKQRRSGHTATRLASGKVLLAGGTDGGGVWDVAELYDPDSNTFSLTTGAMVHQRVWHTATLLDDGKVLLAGGEQAGALPGEFASTAEIYDPFSDTFIAGPSSMPHPLTGHTATIFNTGTVPNKVLLLGNGFAILYDPLLQSFTPTNHPGGERVSGHTATLLDSSHQSVFIAGGWDGSNNLNTTEIYRFATNDFIIDPLLHMIDSRADHTATRLNDGRVLIAGGMDNNGNVLDRAELYNPATQVLSPTSGHMMHPRYRHTAKLLSNGQVLLAGGEDAGGLLPTAEIYSPTTDTFFTPLGSLNVPRSGATATPLYFGLAYPREPENF